MMLNDRNIIEYSVSKDSNNIYAKIFSPYGIVATSLEIPTQGKIKYHREMPS